MKVKIFSRDDVLNLVYEMANRFREDAKIIRMICF